MAHQTNQRRIPASPDPPSPMDPSTAKPHHHHRRRHPPPPILHPQPDPTLSSTINSISHRFSKLYSNHKTKLTTLSTPHHHPHPDDTTFQEKNPIFLDSSCTTLTKSSSVKHSSAAKLVQKNHFLMKEKDAKMVKKPSFDPKRPSFEEFDVKEKDGAFKKQSFDPKRQSFEEFDVKEKDGTMLKKPSLEDPKRPGFEECDVKKVSQLMFKSTLDSSEGVKRGSREGAEVVKGRKSVSSVVPSSVNVGRRRSFCNSQVELADFFSCSGVKVVAVDMPPFMQIHAVDCARKTLDSLEKFTSKTLAHTLKKEFDGVYGPAWHCIVGTSFGSFVTHSVGGFMYFSMDHKIYILLFKTTVQRAE